MESYLAGTLELIVFAFHAYSELPQLKTTFHTNVWSGAAERNHLTLHERSPEAEHRCLPQTILFSVSLIYPFSDAGMLLGRARFRY
jgi:hypothetical protein